MRIFGRSGIWPGTLSAVAGLQTSAAARGRNELAVAPQIDLGHTGSVDFAAGFAPPLVRAWTANLGEGQGARSQALIAQNSVFLNVNGINVYALSLDTGKQQWMHALPCCGQNGAYDRGRLFFLSGSGLMTALSADTGETPWPIACARTTAGCSGFTT